MTSHSTLLAYVIVALLLLPFQSVAGVFGIQHDQDTFNNLNQYMEILVDESNELSLREIRTKRGGRSFVPYLNSNIVLESGTTYWGRITIQNQLEKYTEWILFTGHNSFVDVYVQNKVGFVHKRAGHHHDLQEKDIYTGREPKVRVGLKAGESKVIYVKIYNSDGYQPKIDLRLKNPEKWRKSIERRNLLQGAFHGILLIFFLYNLLLFALNRDRTYLYYSLYIFFIGLYPLSRNNFLREFIIPEGVVLWQSIWIIGVLLYPVFYILFMRKFLDTPKNLPKWDKLFTVATYLLVFLLGACLLIHFATGQLRLVATIATYTTLVSNLFLLFTLIVIINQLRSKLAGYFALGSAALWLGIFSGIYNLVFIDNAEFISTVQIGILFELILFSLGLGYRMRLSEQEKNKAQKGLIEQLEANQSMQVRMNRELEGKVQRRTAEIEQQKREIEIQRDQVASTYEIIKKKNKDITASINYAKRIQQAIMPSEGMIQQSLSDFFLFFRPRDIVSGDFYWFSKVKKMGAVKKVITAVDCTGHGVPGAIMSMIGNDLLSEAVRLMEISQPEEILNYLNKHLKDRLQQEDSTTVRDGMDLSLCVIDEEKREVVFAGAKNPVFYIRDGELHEIKGDKFPIGGYRNKVHHGYQSHTIPLTDSPTWFYLFSDGYQDQFGGAEGKKLGRRKLKELFLEMHTLPPHEQKELLDIRLKDWKGRVKQVDDILVMGFKL